MSVVIDASLTLSWYFELALRLSAPLATRDEALRFAASSLKVPLLGART